MTYREWFAKDFPAKHFDVDEMCPCHFDYMIKCPDTRNRDCAKCWDRKIPEETAYVSQTPDPVPILDNEINPLSITIYPNNIPDPDETIGRVINTAAGIKDRPVYIVIM